MTELLKELEAVVRLDARATPGTVELHTSCSWRRIMAERGRAFLVPTIDPDRHQNMDSIENAQFVVALVNWYRTHHAEIAEALADARRYRFIRDVPYAENIRLIMRDQCNGIMDKAVDAAIDAHNSAREVGE